MALLAGLNLACREAATTTTSSTQVVEQTTHSDSIAGKPPATSTNPAPDHAHRCTTADTTLCPVDEGERDSSFAAYRRQFGSAVAQRNAGELLELTDPKIGTSFGEDGGRAAFQKSLSDPQSGERIWKELSEVIALGGTFRGDGPERMFWAPYVYSTWPDSLKPFTHLAAVRSGVPLRERPSAAERVLRSLDWAIVELIPGDARGAAWRHSAHGGRRNRMGQLR